MAIIARNNSCSDRSGWDSLPHKRGAAPSQAAPSALVQDMTMKTMSAKEIKDRYGAFAEAARR